MKRAKRRNEAWRGTDAAGRVVNVERTGKRYDAWYADDHGIIGEYQTLKEIEADYGCKLVVVSV